MLSIPSWFSLDVYLSVTCRPWYRYTRLCPQGAEGTSYALLVTFFNAALTVSQNVGTLMTRIWDVSNKVRDSGRAMMMKEDEEELCGFRDVAMLGERFPA